MKVDICLATLETLRPRLAEFECSLSASEHALANRRVSETLQNDYILARGWMRSVLAGYVGCEADQLVFADNGHGKPMLENEVWRFNLSHSREGVALAVARDIEVGVDLQFCDARVECAQIAKRFFAKEECDWLLSLPEEGRLSTFYTIWTLKEAYVKAIGLGMRIPLSDFAFRQVENKDVHIVRQPVEYATKAWSIAVVEQSLLPNFALALVADSESIEIELKI